MEHSYEQYVKQYCEGRKVCICPMGVGGGLLAQELLKRGIAVDFFCDSDKGGTEYAGIGCISFEELRSFIRNGENIVVILETTKYFEELKEKLIEYECSDILRLHYLRFFTDDYVQKNEANLEKSINDLCSIVEDGFSRTIVKHICRAWRMQVIPERYFAEIEKPISEIYFDKEIVLSQFKKKLNFVDCGAYTGDTVIGASKKEYIKFGKVFMFELDKCMYMKCKENIEDLRAEGIHVVLYPFGVSDYYKTVKMISGDGSSKITNLKGEEFAEVVALDEILKNEDVNYIKMDIEGEELRALKGAENLIRKQHPVLAVCLYHKPEDMFLIPQYIKRIDSSYKIYIRHYSSSMFDTVCYAL